jgi:hypothetical protein
MEGVNSNTIYLIHCKNLYKCCNVPTLSITIINKKFLKRKLKTDWQGVNNNKQIKKRIPVYVAKS